MAKITTPNKQYTGISASVTFVNGIGQTDNPNLIQWFKAHGYAVEDGNSLDTMTIEELTVYAAEKSIDIGQTTSRSGILKKIKDAKKVGE